MTASINHVSLPAMTLIAHPAAADRGPEIRAAWRDLEARLRSLRGRRFYGVCFDMSSPSAYFAGVVPAHEREAADLQLGEIVVPGGRWARAVVRDWESEPDRIPQVVADMLSAHRRDSSRPLLEYYRQHGEMRILLPI